MKVENEAYSRVPPGNWNTPRQRHNLSGIQSDKLWKFFLVPGVILLWLECKKTDRCEKGIVAMNSSEQSGKRNMDTFQALGRFLADALEGLDAWWQRPETQNALLKLLDLPGQIEGRLEAQRKFLRRGILPSNPVIALSDELDTITPRTVAEQYAMALESLGHVDDAYLFNGIAKVAAIDCATHTLRVIYPEIEAVARRYIYAPEVSEGIASLVEMRLAIGDLLTDSPLGSVAEIIAVERFVFVNLLAIDFAYKRSHETIPRGMRVFAKVANRHQVCHGLSGEYERMHVINALTLLYVAIIVGQFMAKEGTRLRKGSGNIHQILDQQRNAQRAVNREMLSLVRVFQPLTPPQSSETKDS